MEIRKLEIEEMTCGVREEFLHLFAENETLQRSVWIDLLESV
jgi:hypothetical protein